MDAPYPEASNTNQSGLSGRQRDVSNQAGKLPRSEFRWSGLDLHFGRRRAPVLTLVQDGTYSHLYRIRYPNGWTSPPTNIARVKDAAYGHARSLLAEWRRALTTAKRGAS